MRVWTAHTRPHAAPVLVREGFCWAALLFGPFWLLAHRAWIAAAASAAGFVLCALLPRPWGGVLGLALALGLGVFARDLWRLALDGRGFRLSEVVTAADADAALGRLLARRPELLHASLFEALR